MATLLRDFGEIFVSGLDFFGDKQIFNHGNGYNASNNVVVTGNVYITKPIMGDGLVQRSNGVHTLFVDTTNFTGNIQIEATIGKDPINSSYLPVNVVSTVDSAIYPQLTYNNRNGTGNTTSFYTITGQYSWLRANISGIQTGILNLLKLAY